MQEVAAADGQYRNWGLVHGYIAGLVLSLGPAYGCLLGHHLLTFVGEDALLAHARAEATVPFVALQSDLVAVVAAPRTVGWRPWVH